MGGYEGDLLPDVSMETVRCCCSDSVERPSANYSNGTQIDRVIRECCTRGLQPEREQEWLRIASLACFRASGGDHIPLPGQPGYELRMIIWKTGKATDNQGTITTDPSLSINELISEKKRQSSTRNSAILTFRYITFAWIRALTRSAKYTTQLCIYGAMVRKSRETSTRRRRQTPSRSWWKGWAIRQELLSAPCGLDGSGK